MTTFLLLIAIALLATISFTLEGVRNDVRTLRRDVDLIHQQVSDLHGESVMRSISNNLHCLQELVDAPPYPRNANWRDEMKEALHETQ